MKEKRFFRLVKKIKLSSLKLKKVNNQKRDIVNPFKISQKKIKLSYKNRINITEFFQIYRALLLTLN